MATGAQDYAALIQAFGRDVSRKFATGAGEPEEHLRGPVEDLMKGFASLTGRTPLVLAGEDRPEGLNAKPDFAVYLGDALVGFIELKAPGKGANPDKFRLSHDKGQWEQLKSLPNVLYSDGNAWALYSYGERHGEVAVLEGDIEAAGSALRAPDAALQSLLTSFLTWEPQPPRSARELALAAARLCRLLREEVRELLKTDTGLQAVAEDWRRLLFPDATDEVFADGYAQTITFALLLARVENIDFGDGDLSRIAHRLADTHTLMGRALDVMTDEHVLGRLASALNVLVRVLSVVDWQTLSKGDPENWLLFYELFLSEYDRKLRQRTGSYYTPNRAVDAMTRLVDILLRERLGKQSGLASPDVTIVDPAAGTGTYIFRIIERIASTVAEHEGEAEVPAKLAQAASRLIGFELQTGPYAVAEFRLAEEYRRHGATVKKAAHRLYLTDTLDDPYAEEGHLPAVYQPIAQSRRDANRVKRDEDVLVVIGNPPYKERSRGEGGWVEAGRPDKGQRAILEDFIPPPEWGLSAHVKHLYNPYVYFWRWASWKVFEHVPEAAPVPQDPRGVVALITVSGFLNGPGFAAMRQHLRRVSDAIWVIDLSPEGHQPPVSTRVFKGVQQPICITIAIRDGSTGEESPAPVKHIAFEGQQEDKFEQLEALTFDDSRWADCSEGWRAPFLPMGSAQWLSMPQLEELLPWSGSGTMIGRTWVRSPSAKTLTQRWQRFIEAPLAEKPALLDEHQDRTINKVLSEGLPGYPPSPRPLAEEKGSALTPVRIAFRSFDRQWMVPDKRLINRPNPSVWWTRSPRQIYLTILSRTAPSGGPAATLAADVPDLDHYRGSFGGRVFPLWRDPDANVPNVAPGLAEALELRLGTPVAASDVFAYVSAVLSSPHYIERFRDDLRTPGLRLPMTADVQLFTQAVRIGRRVVWLHTFGERFVDPADGRPLRAPRAEDHRRPKVRRAIPGGPAGLPERMEYRGDALELHVGEGIIAPVEPAVWDYQVSGMHVLKHWFGYRKRNPEGKKSSPLDSVVHEEWDPSWTTELLDIINVLTLLVDLHDVQGELLSQICAGPLVTVEDLETAGVLPIPLEAQVPPKPQAAQQGSLLD